LPIRAIRILNMYMTIRSVISSVDSNNHDLFLKRTRKKWVWNKRKIEEISALVSGHMIATSKTWPLWIALHLLKKGWRPGFLEIFVGSSALTAKVLRSAIQIFYIIIIIYYFW
jgi:hypothetical protein